MPALRFLPLVIPITETRPDFEPGEPPKPALFGRLTLAWAEFLRRLNTDLENVELVQIRRWALADQVTLAANDAGYLAFVTDYGHLVRWTGTVWEFAPGDLGNGFFRDFAVTPQETGWKLADGTATDYLVVGAAALSVTAITPPDLNGTAAYRKSAAAYSGSIVAGAGASGATAPAVSGSTGSTAPGVSGNTGASASSASNIAYQTGATSSQLWADSNHSHSDGTLVVDGHTHAVGTLAVDSHTHGVGTLDPAHLNVLVYFRR